MLHAPFPPKFLTLWALDRGPALAVWGEGDAGIPTFTSASQRGSHVETVEIWMNSNKYICGIC